MNILVTGVPATGKTSVASLLARRTGLEWREINDVSLENSFYLGYDYTRESYIIDEELTASFLEKLASEMSGIILSGSVLLFPAEFFQLIVVLHASPAVLRDRMLNRGYSDKKIEENIEAELLSVVLGDAMDLYTDVEFLEFDTSEQDPEEIVEKIVVFLNRQEFKTRRLDS